MTGGRVHVVYEAGPVLRMYSPEHFAELTAGLTMALFQRGEQVSEWVPFEAGKITARLGFHGRVTEVRYARDGQVWFTAELRHAVVHRRRSRLLTVHVERLPLTAVAGALARVDER